MYDLISVVFMFQIKRMFICEHREEHMLRALAKIMNHD